MRLLMRRSADLPRRHCQQASSDDAEGAAMQRADAQTSQYTGAIGWRTRCRRAWRDDASSGKRRRWLCAEQVCVARRNPHKAISASLAGANARQSLQGQVTTATAVGEDSGLMGISTMQRGTAKSTTCRRTLRPSSAQAVVCRWRLKAVAVGTSKYQQKYQQKEVCC